MRNWRVLCLLLSLCFICGLSSGVAFAAESDNYADSGLGWYCKSDFLFSGVTQLATDSTRNRIFSKASNGSSILVLYTYLESGRDVYRFYLVSTNESDCVLRNSGSDGSSDSNPSFSVVIDDTTWYCAYYSLDSKYWTLSVSIPSVTPIFSSNSSIVSSILDAAGVTFDSSVLVPPTPAATHELVTHQSSPFVFSAGVNGSAGTNRLTGPYEVANSYTNEIFGGGSSVSRWSLGPESGKASAQYVVYKDVDYKASDYVSVSVSGTVSASFSTNNPPFGRNVLIPSQMGLVINDSVSTFSNVSFDGYELTVSGTNLYTNVFGDIKRIGVWMAFDNSLGSFSAGDFDTLYFTLNDNLVITPGEAPAEDPTPVDDIKQDTGQGGILGLLKSILDFFANFFGRLFDGLIGLFVPSSDMILNIKLDYENLLADRLGFIWQAGEWLLSFFGDLKDSVTDYEVHQFVFPEISFPMNGETVKLVDSQPVSLQNPFMDVVRPVLGTIVSIICVLAFINTAEEMVIAVTSGASYFQYLKGRGEE